MKKGSISLPVLAGGAMTGVAMIGSVFAWTYTQFSAVTTHASQTDVTLAGVVQKTTDIDDRLTRIENKLDIIIQIKAK